MFKGSTEARKDFSDKKSDNSTTKANDADFKNAVKLGTAKGNDTENRTDGYPTYFTITDYRSHNEYTFQFSRVKDGKLYYKWDKTDSDLTKDDQDKYNNTNWVANSSFNTDTEFEVRIVNGEIKLSYEGEALAHKR